MNMRIKIFCLLIFLIPVFLHAQKTYTIHGKIAGCVRDTAYLQDFYGYRNTTIDTAIIDKSGDFEFNLSDKDYTGFYRVKFADRKYVDVIFNKENISFSSVYDYLNDSLKITGSKENAIFHEYKMEREKNQSLLDMLNQYLHEYPVAEPFYKKIQEEFIRINKEEENYINNLVKKNAGMYAVRVIKSDQNPMPPVDMPEAQKVNYVKQHFLDAIDFSDSTLIKSALIESQALSYFRLYMEKNMDKEQQEEAFIKAVDNIMGRAGVNITVYNFVLDFLSRAFEKTDYDLVYTYLMETYAMTNSCESDEKKLELKEKIEKMKSLAPGKTAPDFEMTNPSDSTKTKLSDIKADYILIIFWASWCPHCKVTLSSLRDVYSQYKSKGLEILAISIDKDGKEWMDAVVSNGYSWLNYSDLQGWKSGIPVMYNVRATPTMYLIDQNRKVISKPLTIEQLNKKLSELIK